MRTSWGIVLATLMLGSIAACDDSDPSSGHKEPTRNPPLTRSGSEQSCGLVALTLRHKPMDEIAEQEDAEPNLRSLALELTKGMRAGGHMPGAMEGSAPSAFNKEERRALIQGCLSGLRIAGLGSTNPPPVTDPTLAQLLEEMCRFQVAFDDTGSLLEALADFMKAKSARFEDVAAAFAEWLPKHAPSIPGRHADTIYESCLRGLELGDSQGLPPSIRPTTG